MRIFMCFVLFVVGLMVYGLGHAVAVEPAPSSSEVAQFNKLIAERTAFLDELKKLDKEYKDAAPERKEAIITQVKTMIPKLNSLHKQVISLAEKMYAGPKPDPRAEKLLVANCEGCFAVGDYENALRLAKLLISHGAKEPKLFLWGGISAFCISDYDLAQKYLTVAAKQGVKLHSGKGNPLDPTFLKFMQNPKEFESAWKKEQEIRAREAKANDLPQVLLKTNKGDIVIELFENEAPNTVANFISLVEKGYYNGTPFHRVLDGFMAQGGDNGKGGPPYTIECECYRPDYRKHFRGSLSMAHTGMKNTGSAQFFLTFIPTTHLDGVHTVFGRIIKGMDVLPKIRRRNPQDPRDASVRPDGIIEAKVIRKRPHDYVPKTIPR